MRVHQQQQQQPPTFEEVVRLVSDSSREPPMPLSTSQKLRMYGLFKCATVGAPPLPRPNIFQLVERRKHDAWAQACADFPDGGAREAYVRMFAELSAPLQWQAPTPRGHRR